MLDARMDLAHRSDLTNDVNVEIELHDQRDQIGQFLKVLGDNFSHNSSPNIWPLWGLFSKLRFFKYKLPLLFLGDFRKKIHLVTLNFHISCKVTTTNRA